MGKQGVGGRIAFKRILETCGLGYGWKRGCTEGVREFRIPRKVGN
jgi:hypothetical protein